MCDKGSAPSLLLAHATPSVRLRGLQIAVVSDVHVYAPFGVCAITTSTCAFSPSGAWPALAASVTFGGIPPLIQGATLPCAKGGVVVVIDVLQKTVDVGKVGTSPETVQALAQLLLNNPNVSFPYRDTKGMSAKEVLEEIVRSGRGPLNTPDTNETSTSVNPNMLRALVEYAKEHKIGINPITNADHSAQSNHYKGDAVDLNCSPALDRDAFEKIAARYGGTNNGEVCPTDKHYHYDFKR